MSSQNRLRQVQIRCGGERRIHADRRKEERIGAVSERRLLGERRSI